MKRLFLALLAMVALCVPLPAAAQVVSAVTIAACGTPQNTPVAGNPYPLTMDLTGKLCSSGGGSSSSTPFTPTGNVSLATTTASARVALATTDTTAILVNNGASDLWFKLGNASVTATVGTDTFLGTGRATVVAVAAGQTNVAAINSSGTSSLVATQGTGSPFFSGGGGSSSSSGATRKLLSSTLTRIANTTAYAGTSAAPTAVCLFTSVTICAPLTLTVSSTVTVNGSLLNVRLFKSSLGTTGATFRVLAYQGAPTLTSTFDTTVYTPKLADEAVYVGAWNCNAQVVNGDNSSYECTSTSGDGHQTFQLTDGVLKFVIETTGLYAPASGETFNIAADILASAP